MPGVDVDPADMLACKLTLPGLLPRAIEFCTELYNDRESTPTMPIRPSSAPRPDLAEMLTREQRPVPSPLLDRGEAFVPDLEIDSASYTDPAFTAREFRGMWSRVWQMACRVEDIPNTGDSVLYEIGDLSFVVLRERPDRIRAFVNACLHRGRALRDGDGRISKLRCPFHGFTWNLDGSCAKIVCEWDFAHVDREEFRLPEAQVATWGGFVFLNPDADAEPLETFLERVPADYETRGWSLADRRKTVHVQKINRCNWKVALEAFIESFHVTQTHRSAAPYLGDANTQYDVWEGRKHTRMVSPRGLSSPNLAPLADLQIYRAGMRASAGAAAETLELPPEFSSARAALGDARRRLLSQQGVPHMQEATDCELIDTIQYHVFPNLVIWAGWGSYLVYRFRPLGTETDMSVMDVMFVDPLGQEGPPIAPQLIGPDASLHEAPQLGGYCSVFDEDSGNLGAIQKGLKRMIGKGPVTGSYQEARIRNFHHVLGGYVGNG